MTTRFYVFAESREALARRVELALEQKSGALDLKTLDDVLARFDPGEGAIWRGGTANPFVLSERSTSKDLFPTGEAGVGWGAPLAGDAAEVAELAGILRGSENPDDPAQRCTLGGEFRAAPLTASPHWQHWSAGTGRGLCFGTRRHARRLIGADALGARGLDGEGVRVLVIDRGISQAYVESLGGDYGEGFDWDPGTGVQLGGHADAPYQSTPREHGALMVRSILDLAPAATIWDLPLLPPQVRDVTHFALAASFAFFAVRLVTTILSHRRWVIVNAWGIDSRFGEDIWDDYAGNPLHPLNFWISRIGRDWDVVFAAGNNGQFRPGRDAGPYDRGPGRSIFGGNAGGTVTSVGAVRGDGLWVGTSSQGPAPTALGAGGGPNEKPDFCAPGWFAEPDDRALLNTGTSTACAVTAGVIAALRTRERGWPDLSPARLRATLRDTARRDWHTGWNGRAGAGMLNVPAALAALP